MKWLLVPMFLLTSLTCLAQPSRQARSKISVWIPLQAVPSLTWYSDPSQSAFGFEWEVTPLLYSFGMNKQNSPWYSFFVEPPARFTGSVELNVAGQIFTSKVGTSYFAASANLMGYVPLIARGEELTLNVGVGAYQIANRTRVFAVGGFSTLFSFVHLNLKHASNPSTWIVSLEFRFF